MEKPRTDSEITGVTDDEEGLREIREMNEGVEGEGRLELVKGGLMGREPSESMFSKMSQFVQRGADGAEVGNKSTIKVAKADEGLDLFHRLWTFPSEQRLKLSGIHFYSLRGDKEA